MNYYEHFCTEHLFMLAAIILVLVTVGVNIRKASDRSVTILLRILACILLVCEAVQEYVLVLEGGHLIDFPDFQSCIGLEKILQLLHRNTLKHKVRIFVNRLLERMASNGIIIRFMSI